MSVSVKNTGGGSVYSDELTATAAEVLSGYTYVGEDSNDEMKTGVYEHKHFTSNSSYIGGASSSGFTIRKSYITSNGARLYKAYGAYLLKPYDGSNNDLTYQIGNNHSDVTMEFFKINPGMALLVVKFGKAVPSLHILNMTFSKECTIFELIGIYETQRL